MASVYDSERLAAAYARDRPPIHERILRAARLSRQADLALDIGCGAGLSTAALAPLAKRAIGLEPISTMLTHRRTVAPHASFLRGQAERLPPHPRPENQLQRQRDNQAGGQDQDILKTVHSGQV